MRSEHWALVIGIALALCLAAATQSACAEAAGALTLHQAMLVIQFGDGSHLVRCVSFSEHSISGLELLKRSGLEISTWGTAVCRIGRDGCEYPREKCFCRCPGRPCVYWSYWRWRDGGWVYSQVGSADHEVSDGNVEGWVWGSGESPPSIAPPRETCLSAKTRAPDNGAEPRDALSVVPVPAGQYVAFLAMASLLVAGFLRQRNRSKG